MPECTGLNKQFSDGSSKSLHLKLFASETNVKVFKNVVWNDVFYCLRPGSLLITSHRIFFFNETRIFFQFSLGQVQSIRSDKDNNDQPIIITLKLYWQIILYCNFNNQDNSHRSSKLSNSIFKCLQAACFLSTINSDIDCLMPITPSDPKLNTFSHEYSIESEFKRFDLDESRFCLSDQNKRYELCETYPSLLIIPKNLQKSDLMDISYSFIHNEFPVITWHQDGIFILRSAAIWTKFNIQSICLENYFKKLFALSSNCYGVQILRFNDEVDIVDEKAVVNLIQRATPGFVNVHQELTVFNSEVQNAFEAMRCVLQTPSAYSSLQDHFKKLQIYPLITKLLDIAIFGASAMINKRCSLFFKHKSPKGPYCIVLCLIQILVDPYYRTIEGFYKLIQKDWISFGFPFAKSSFHRQQTPHNVRKANNDLNAKSQEAAPYDTPQHSCHIFILFLDCCFQLLIQFCSQFEFNENYLLVFAHELHNCYFLNFLSNNERKYSRFKASYQENSLIYLIDRIRPDLLSSTYNPKNLQPMILPETEHKYLAIWKSLYWRNFPSQKCFKKFHLYYEPY